jgi:MraZ protein
VFKGTYRYRTDAKGRVPVPPPFRRALGGEHRLVVTVLDQCLAAYAPGEWARLEAQLSALPSFSRPVKAMMRLLASRAADCALDVQGRILLPPLLRQAVGLARDVVVVGVLNRFELWSPPAWESFVRDSERLFDDVSLDLQWPPPPRGAASAPPGPEGPLHPQRKPKR